MGDKAAITPFVAAFNAAFNAEHPVSSYGAWTPALQDLLHLRQPEAIAALVQVLFRDERLPSTVDPGPGQEAPFVSPPGPYVAFDALSYLSRYVENWPSKAFPPSAEGLQQAREWVTKQGIANLKIKR
jgi:hypothetical protein